MVNLQKIVIISKRVYPEFRQSTLGSCNPFRPQEVVAVRTQLTPGSLPTWGRMISRCPGREISPNLDTWISVLQPEVPIPPPRARVARVRAEYPSQLDYSGIHISNTHICSCSKLIDVRRPFLAFRRVKSEKNDTEVGLQF